MSEMSELMTTYSSAMKGLTINLEAMSQGELQNAVENLREVYVGQGADSFFSRWDQSDHQVSECLEQFVSLQIKLDEWLEVLEAFDQLDEV